MIIDHVEEMAPIIYTPTIGEVCLQYSRLYRRARGMFFSADDVGDMHAMAWNWPSDRVDVIVLTDGSRILGLGDLGVQGMGIPIGKLDLYVAGAGVHPSFVLPICLDVGTDNLALRADPCYLGISRPRLTGDAYYAAVDELVSALRARWPSALLQFEARAPAGSRVVFFRGAARVADAPARGRGPVFRTSRPSTRPRCWPATVAGRPPSTARVPLFGLVPCRFPHPVVPLRMADDIQGTAAVVLAGVYGALAAQGLPPSAIVEQRFLVCGAGSAGMGITQALFSAMMRHGLGRELALRNFCVLDAGGVIGAARTITELLALAAPFARRDIPDGTALEAAIDFFKPVRQPS